VAVKVVKLSSLTFQKLEELLEQEIAITRSLDHPNTIRCHEVLKSVNHCYFITELCHDGTLEKLLKKRGPMPEEEAWPFIRDVYQGLKYLASRNIVHRDVKLANIFLSKGTAKLADFGFAVYTKYPYYNPGKTSKISTSALLSTWPPKDTSITSMALRLTSGHLDW
jgi:serine/threonine protein kinase